MILVAGATGMLGSAIVERLLRTGKQVRAMVRNSAAEEALQQAGAEPVVADLKRPDSLERACEGASAVITTANSAGRGGEDNVESVDLQGNVNLVDAASAAGVERFVFVSAQGEDPASPVPFLRAKGTASARLRRSGMTYTVLQPDYYMDVWMPLVVLGPVAAGRPVSIVGEASRKHYPVAVDDVAAFAVASLERDSARDRDLLIGGPQALSWRDIISTLEQLQGSELKVQALQPGEPMPGFPDAVSGLMASLETYDSPQPISAAEASEAFGVRLTSLEEFLRRRLG